MNQPTVLIADDDAHVLTALRVRLRASGYDVIECRYGLGVIGAIANRAAGRIAAFILDHDMPLGEGRAIAHHIRKFSDAPIIFFSGHGPDEFRDTVMRLPNTYYLPKPLDAERLTELLHAVTASA